MNREMAVHGVGVVAVLLAERQSPHDCHAVLISFPNRAGQFGQS